MVRHNTNEDLNGYIRGAHQDGPDICDRFEFHKPGSSSTPENVVWGWNDLDSLYCERCKRLATEHLVLKAPKPIDEMVKPTSQLPKPAAYTAPTGSGGNLSVVDATALNPTETEERRARAAEQAAYFNAGYDNGTGMLDEMNDPLAINARPKPKPPLPEPPHQGMIAAAAAAPPPTRGANLSGVAYKPPMSYDEIMAMSGENFPPPSAGVDGVKDPALAELLSRDASANEAFKREVERMVREAARKEEVDARLGAPPPAVSAPAAGATIVAESKDLSGTTVPMGTFADSAALLASVGLERYGKTFEEEEMDPDTLIEVLQQQGKASLEEALKELGIKSMGHRLKIINALIIQ